MKKLILSFFNIKSIISIEDCRGEVSGMSMQELMKYRNIAKGKFLRENSFKKIDNIEYEKKENNSIIFKVHAVGETNSVEVKVSYAK